MVIKNQLLGSPLQLFDKQLPPVEDKIYGDWHYVHFGVFVHDIQLLIKLFHFLHVFTNVNVPLIVKQNMNIKLIKLLLPCSSEQLYKQADPIEL